MFILIHQEALDQYYMAISKTRNTGTRNTGTPEQHHSGTRNTKNS